MGLRQRILQASTPEEITALCESGKTYEYASVRTRNSWAHAANRRLRELSKGSQPSVPQSTIVKSVNNNRPNKRSNKNAKNA